MTKQQLKDRQEAIKSYKAIIDGKVNGFKIPKRNIKVGSIIFIA